MKYIKLGKSDLKVSLIGLGTGQFGSRAWGYGIWYGAEECMRIIHKAIENGINVFDTAETYGNGLSERLLGKALKNYERDEFVIITKVAPWNLSYKGVMKAIQRSLKRLNLGMIDLYLIHYPNPFGDLKGTLRAMETLIKIGKIRYLGVSNFSVSLLKKAQELLSSAEIIANEIEYNILSQRAKERLIPYCRKEKIGVIAYSPLAGGVLSGKYSAENPPRDRARAFNFLARKRILRKAQPLFNVLWEIASKHEASVAQVALAWIIRQNICAIPAALTLKQVNENAKASDLLLGEEEIEKINKAAISLDRLTYYFDRYIIRNISWAKETFSHLILSRSSDT